MYGPHLLFHGYLYYPADHWNHYVYRIDANQQSDHSSYFQFRDLYFDCCCVFLFNLYRQNQEQTDRLVQHYDLSLPRLGNYDPHDVTCSLRYTRIYYPKEGSFTNPSYYSSLMIPNQITTISRFDIPFFKNSLRSSLR